MGKEDGSSGASDMVPPAPSRRAQAVGIGESRGHSDMVPPLNAAACGICRLAELSFVRAEKNPSPSLERRSPASAPGSAGAASRSGRIESVPRPPPPGFPRACRAAAVCTRGFIAVSASSPGRSRPPAGTLLAARAGLIRRRAAVRPPFCESAIAALTLFSYIHHHEVVMEVPLLDCGIGAGSRCSWPRRAHTHPAILAAQGSSVKHSPGALSRTLHVSFPSHAVAFSYFAVQGPFECLLSLPRRVRPFAEARRQVERPGPHPSFFCFSSPGDCWPFLQTPSLAPSV